jgi:hypothetical protein
MRLGSPVDVFEVSLVDAPASGRPFSAIISKRADGGLDLRGPHFQFRKALDDGQSTLVVGPAYYAARGPEEADKQDDWTDMPTLQEMKKSWEANGRKLFLQHKEALSADEAELVSSEIVGSEWILKVRVRGRLRDMVRTKAVTGYSISGRATRKALPDEQDEEDDMTNDETIGDILETVRLLVEDDTVVALEAAVTLLESGVELLDADDEDPMLKTSAPSDRCGRASDEDDDDLLRACKEAVAVAGEIVGSDEPSTEELVTAVGVLGAVDDALEDLDSRSA